MARQKQKYYLSLNEWRRKKATSLQTSQAEQPSGGKFGLERQTSLETRRVSKPETSGKQTPTRPTVDSRQGEADSRSEQRDRPTVRSLIRSALRDGMRVGRRNGRAALRWRPNRSQTPCGLRSRHRKSGRPVDCSHPAFERSSLHDRQQSPSLAAGQAHPEKRHYLDRDQFINESHAI